MQSICRNRAPCHYYFASGFISAFFQPVNCNIFVRRSECSLCRPPSCRVMMRDHTHKHRQDHTQCWCFTDLCASIHAQIDHLCFAVCRGNDTRALQFKELICVILFQLHYVHYVGAKLQATNRVPRPVDRGTATRYGG